MIQTHDPNFDKSPSLMNLLVTNLGVTNLGMTNLLFQLRYLLRLLIEKEPILKKFDIFLSCAYGIELTNIK